MNENPCGPDGCAQLQLIKDNTEKIVKAVDKFEEATHSLTGTVHEMNTNLKMQNMRLEHGAEEFKRHNKRIGDLEHEVYGSEDFEGLKTRMSVAETTVENIKGKMPSKKSAIVAGGGSAGGGIIIWEFIQALFRAKTGQ